METGNSSPTRERILKTSFNLFLSHGYDGTSLSRIVGASNVSKGAFYHHFASKADIYGEVVHRFFVGPLLQFDTAELRDMSPRKARSTLKSFYRTLPDLVARTTDQDMTRYFSMMFEAISRLPDFRRDISRLYSQLHKDLSRAFARGQKPTKRQKRLARRFLARMEGEIYLSAVMDN